MGTANGNAMCKTVVCCEALTCVVLRTKDMVHEKVEIKLSGSMKFAETNPTSILQCCKSQMPAES